LRLDELNLRPELQQSLAEAGYETCTPIQELTLPESLAGHDLIGVAKTGTGKTAAFVVPILQNLEPGGDPQALVICPTRELALQVGGEVEKLGARLAVRAAVLYGGTSLGPQKQQLLEGVDIVVGTPGRLLDFMTSAYLPMRKIRWLVLDEADRMLDMGFIDDVDKILRRVPMSRQTMLFSATLPGEVMKLAHRYMLYPKEFRVDPGTQVPAAIEQIFLRCSRDRKVDLLRAILRAERPHKTLIFTATRDGTSEIARRLRSDGHEVYPISSNLRQADRERVLHGFRDGTISMLVATDVAARGIDIDDISHVINLDLPMEPQDYVHRIGRTGRVERSGRAISLVEPRDISVVRQIERLLGMTADLRSFPGFEAPEVLERDAARAEGGGRRRGRGGRSGGGGRARSGGRSEGGHRHESGSMRDRSAAAASVPASAEGAHSGGGAGSSGGGDQSRGSQSREPSRRGHATGSPARAAGDRPKAARHDGEEHAPQEGRQAGARHAAGGAGEGGGRRRRRRGGRGGGGGRGSSGGAGH
jgi:superfamily II DNA/RNA helicase